MSEESTASLPVNIYEEELNEETVCDLSSQGLQSVPELENRFLCGLYLQNNKLTTLPDDLFTSLPHLLYLDVRDNKLTDLPKSVENHQGLTHLLLRNNKITSLPNELGTVINLKVLQIGGNPIMYPPRDVIKAGISTIIQYLHKNYIVDNILVSSQSDVSDTVSTSNGHVYNQQARSYNSVIDGDKFKKNKTLSIRFNERESEDSDEEIYKKSKRKCPKLAKSRLAIPHHYQSSKYLKSVHSDSIAVHDRKMKHQYLKEMALKKHKELLATRDKILQGRKNFELLKDWRKNYQIRQFTADGSYKLDHMSFPYDTNPEYMTLLTREDIEKDLPDKYRKRLVRKCKPTVPRKSNNDVHLALKIKQLFENLEAIDLNKKDVTPRTEQRMLLNEIQKITEIKQKLMELSATNTISVTED